MTFVVYICKYALAVARDTPVAATRALKSLFLFATRSRPADCGNTDVRVEFGARAEFRVEFCSTATRQLSVYRGMSVIVIYRLGVITYARFIVCQALSHGPRSSRTDISTLIDRHVGAADRRAADHDDAGTGNGAAGHRAAIQTAAQRAHHACDPEHDQRRSARHRL